MRMGFVHLLQQHKKHNVINLQVIFVEAKAKRSRRVGINSLFHFLFIIHINQGIRLTMASPHSFKKDENTQNSNKTSQLKPTPPPRLLLCELSAVSQNKHPIKHGQLRNNHLAFVTFMQKCELFCSIFLAEFKKCWHHEIVCRANR